MANTMLTRILITLTVSTIGLFFKIKEARVNRIFKRVYGGEQLAPIVATSSGGSRDLDRIPAAFNCARCDKYFTDSNYVLVEQEAKSKLPHVDAYVRYYSQFFRWFYWYLLLKNLGRCMLESETLASWRYLDCFMPGRFIMNGRVIQMAPYFSCFETLVWLLWSYTIAWLTTEIKMPCVEFLLDACGNGPYWLRQETPLEARNHANDQKEGECHSSLLEYMNPFVGTPFYKMRPNRTRAAWHSLARMTNWYYGGAVSFGLILMPPFLRMSLPVALTRRGFEYNYRLCVEWITTSHRVAPINATGSVSWASSIANEIYSSFRPPNAGALDLGRAYSKPEIVRDLFMPWVDLVSLSYFQLLRVTLDVSETILLYSTVALSFNSVCFMSVLMSLDVLYYCKSINRQLKQLLVKLNHTNSGESLLVGSETTRHLKADTADVQAQIADMFAILDTYNKYMSFQCTYQLLFWIGYAAMVSSWMFIPDNVSSKVDWYTMHAFATAYFFIMLSNMSMVRRSCHQMHELMSSAMALDNKGDEGTHRSKKIWLSLLRFYKPRPLYCFTMIESVELTIMSGLEMVAWLFGALVIASSFFQVHNIK